MDLVLPDATPTEEERASVDAVLGPPSSGWSGGERAIEFEGRVARGGHEAREQRHLLLPALHALQSGAGWISPGGLRYVCERLDVPPAELRAFLAQACGMMAAETICVHETPARPIKTYQFNKYSWVHSSAEMRAALPTGFKLEYRAGAYLVTASSGGKAARAPRAA